MTSWWNGLLDDAARFPPGNAPIAEAVKAYVARRDSGDASLVAALVVKDTDLPDVEQARGGESIPLAVVVTGGAGQVAGPLAFCHDREGLELTALEITMRSLDDPVHNARRIEVALGAARDAGTLAESTLVYLEVPRDVSASIWAATADVAAEQGWRLKFRTGGSEPGQAPDPPALAKWIDGALDREVPFKCTAGLHHAVAGEGRHGFLNVALATLDLLASESVATAAARLHETDPDTVAAAAKEADLDSARRFFASFGTCDVDQPWKDLVELGLT